MDPITIAAAVARKSLTRFVYTLIFNHVVDTANMSLSRRHRASTTEPSSPSATDAAADGAYE